LTIRPSMLFRRFAERLYLVTVICDHDAQHFIGGE